VVDTLVQYKDRTETAQKGKQYKNNTKHGKHEIENKNTKQNKHKKNIKKLKSSN